MDTPIGSIPYVEKRGRPIWSGGDFLPPADNTYDLGSVAYSWRNVYFETAIYGGSVAGDWKPSADDTYTLGTTALGWKSLFLPDGVLHNQTAALNANTAVTNVLIGTPVAQALAAKSLIISNVVANGDIAFYGNLGGNSQQFLFYDTSASVLYLGSGTTPSQFDGSGNLRVKGRITVGDSALGNYGNYFNTTLTSSGLATYAAVHVFSGTITGFSGDTDWLAGTVCNANITTQATDTVAYVAGLRLKAPTVSIGAGGTVPITASLYVVDAPTGGTTNAAIYVASGNADFLGSVLIGSGTAYGRLGQKLEVNATAASGGLAFNNWSTTATERAFIDFNRSKSATPGTYTAVVADDQLGAILFRGADGTDFQNSAYISVKAVGTVGTDRVPGIMDFHLFTDTSTTYDLITLSMKADNLTISTSNAAQTAKVDRLSISGALATAVATWSNVTHSGFVSSADMTTLSLTALNATSDLTIRANTAADYVINFQGYDTGVGYVSTASVINGADPFMCIGRSDTGVATNAVTDMLRLQAGAGASAVSSNFGFGIPIWLSNSASTLAERASIDFVLTNATAGSEDVNMVINLMDGGAAPAAVLTLTGADKSATFASSITATNAQFTPATGASVNVGTSCNFKRFYAEVTLATDNAETDVGLTPGAVILSAAIRVSVEIAGLDSADHHIQLGINGAADKYIDVAQGAAATTISVNKKGNYTFDPTTDTEAAALKLTITGGADQIPSAGKVYVEVVYLDSTDLADV